MTAAQLDQMPYKTVEDFYRWGCISQEDWEAYCDRWRNSVVRYSTVAEAYQR